MSLHLSSNLLIVLIVPSCPSWRHRDPCVLLRALRNFAGFQWTCGTCRRL